MKRRGHNAFVTRCPCCSGEVYDECCGPVHAGTRPAHTAEQLMRSRFSAFARGDTAYLLASWHPSTRPASIDLDDAVRWIRLEIVDVVDGRQWDDHGVVEFRAHHRVGRTPGVLAERSSFVRQEGRWVYLSGRPSDT